MDENFNNEQDPTSSALSKLKQGTSKAIKKISQASKKLGNSLKNPFFWKIMLIIGGVLLAILLIIILISVIASIFSADFYDKEKGTMSSVFGITGDSFYGARILYKDDELASTQIQDDYLNLTYSLLTDIKNAGISLVPINADFKNDNSVKLITKNYAQTLAKMSESEEGTTGESEYTLEQSTLKIDHFGLKNEEITLVLNSIASTISSNNLSETEQAEIQTKINRAFENEKYAKYKTVCNKIYIHDHYLPDENTAMEDLSKRNYVGFIFMPKEDIALKSTSFRFVVDEGSVVNAEMKYKDNQNITSIVPSTEIDSTWYDDGDYTTLETEENINIDLTKFNLANPQALASPVSIYQLINDNLYSNYFNAVDEYSANNLLENIKADKYFYLQMTSDKAFNFAEYSTEY